MMLIMMLVMVLMPLRKDLNDHYQQYEDITFPPFHPGEIDLQFDTTNEMITALPAIGLQEEAEPRAVSHQIMLAAWAVVIQRESKDPWLKRVVVVAGIMVFWLVIWYMARILPVSWRPGRVMGTVGLSSVTSGLYLLWEWIRQASNSDQ